LLRKQEQEWQSWRMANTSSTPESRWISSRDG